MRSKSTLPIRLRKFIAAALLLAAPTGAAQQKPAPPADCAADEVVNCAALAAVDAAAQQMVTTGQAAGLAVGVVRGGRLVFNRGYGKANLELNVPVTTETVFPIFSITKTYTAAAIMQMAERGQLKLEDPLSKYFPGFPRGGEVSLRQLLNHTSGIHDYAAPDFPLNTVGATSDELTKYIATQKVAFNFDPGTRWSYSNANYALLGKIIEKVSGKSYREYMAENIFSKLGLKNTAVDRNRDVVPNRASGYMLDGLYGRFVNGIYIDMSIPYAAGAIRSNVEDVADFFAALFDGRVVSTASLREMTTPARLKDGRLATDFAISPATKEPYKAAPHGLGLTVGETPEGGRLIFSGGSFPSFTSDIRYYPDRGVTVIALANTGSQASGKLVSRISRILFAGPKAAATAPGT